MKKLVLLLGVLALAAMGAAAYGTASIYGLTGLIETPDDAVAPTNSVSLTGNYIPDIDDTGYDFSSYGGAFGVMPNLEVGGVAMDISEPGLDMQAVISAKYRLAAETLESPAVAVGVVDASNRLEKFSDDLDNASFFIVAGKNITAMAEGFSGMVSKPLRGTIGIGTGVYKGVFAGLNWYAAPKFDIAAEYLANGLRQEGTFNAALRFRPTDTISIQAGTFAFKDVYIGGSLMISTY